MLAFPILLAAAVSSPDFPDLSCITLAKGDGFVFHAVRTGYRSPITLPEAHPPARYVRDHPYGSDSITTEVPWMVTHTDLRTGRMTKLFQGGGWSFRDGSPNIGRGVRTASVSSVVSAFAADEKHFYLLHVQAKSSSHGGRGESEVSCTLRVYDGKKGRLVATHPVEGYKPPAPRADLMLALSGRQAVPEGLTRLDIADGRLTIGKSEFRTVEGVLLPFPKK